MREKKKESWFSGGEGAAAPHTIPAPLGLAPAAGAWGQRTDRVSGAGMGLQALARDQGLLPTVSGMRSFLPAAVYVSEPSGR